MRHKLSIQDIFNREPMLYIYWVVFLASFAEWPPLLHSEVTVALGVAVIATMRIVILTWYAEALEERVTALSQRCDTLTRRCDDLTIRIHDIPPSSLSRAYDELVQHNIVAAKQGGEGTSFHVASLKPQETSK